MFYCEREDILREISLSKLIELTQDDPATTEPDWEVVDKAIEDATNLINSYISQKYSLPLPSVPQILEKFCVDIAIYEIYSRRLNALPAEDYDNIPVVKRYKEALNWLKDVASGKASIAGLDTSGQPVSNDSPFGEIYYEAEEAKF